MSMLSRTTAWKAGLALLGGCCLAVVIVAGASATAKTPPAVDHQLCYRAGGTFKVPTGIRLINQFSPNGFVPVINQSETFHCNPVVKTVPGGRVYLVTNPAAHLDCFGITPPVTQQTHKVLVQNQFGQAVLQTNQPNFLCVPSWTNPTGPPNKPVNTPPNLNHFTCYSVSVISGAYKPPTTGMFLRDEFTTKNIPAKAGAVPRELCLPTEKIVGKKTYPIINATVHLLCFPGGPSSSHGHVVYDENQFGTAKVQIIRPQWLCLPSTKKVLK